MEYEDPIISHFKGQKEVSAETLAQLIDEQKHEQAAHKTRASPKKVHLQSANLRKCEKALSIFTDVIKLKFLIQKSWDLQALGKSVLVRFDIQTGALSSQEAKLDHAETFYRELALKTITRCGKLSKATEQLSLDLEDIGEHIRSKSDENPAACVENSACLLLEMWFLCGRVMRGLKRNVAALFIKSKLLLIDCELELMNSTAQGGYGNLQETIVSYRSFIKVLLQQLQDAESGNDQTLFEECLQVFLDVESMYGAMNLNWLLLETDQQESDMPSTTESRSAIFEEAAELRDIAQFVDSAVNEEKESGSDEFSSFTTEKLEPTHDRRMSETSSSSRISLMMERTSLTKELPHLLQAFNNAKRLEQELENVRAAKTEELETSMFGSPPPSLSSSMFSPSSSLFLASSPRYGNDITATTYSTSSSMAFDDEEKSTENAPEKCTPIAHPRLVSSELSSHLTGSDFLRLSSLQQQPSSLRQPRSVQGFGSSVLNNLYGLGNRK